MIQMNSDGTLRAKTPAGTITSRLSLGVILRSAEQSLDLSEAAAFRAIFNALCGAPRSRSQRRVLLVNCRGRVAVLRVQ